MEMVPVAVVVVQWVEESPVEQLLMKTDAPNQQDATGEFSSFVRLHKFDKNKHIFKKFRHWEISVLIELFILPVTNRLLKRVDSSICIRWTVSVPVMDGFLFWDTSGWVVGSLDDSGWIGGDGFLNSGRGGPSNCGGLASYLEGGDGTLSCFDSAGLSAVDNLGNFIFL